MPDTGNAAAATALALPGCVAVHTFTHRDTFDLGLFGPVLLEADMCLTAEGALEVAALHYVKAGERVAAPELLLLCESLDFDLDGHVAAKIRTRLHCLAACLHCSALLCLAGVTRQ